MLCRLANTISRKNSEPSGAGPRLSCQIRGPRSVSTQLWGWMSKTANGSDHRPLQVIQQAVGIKRSRRVGASQKPVDNRVSLPQAPCVVPWDIFFVPIMPIPQRKFLTTPMAWVQEATVLV